VEALWVEYRIGFGDKPAIEIRDQDMTKHGGKKIAIGAI